MSLKDSNFYEIKQVHNSVYLDNRGQISKLDLPKGEVFDSILISKNNLAGTVRGLHFQKPPYGEVKIVTCTKGSIMDFVLDVRIDSPLFGKWEKFQLSDREPMSLVIPKGFAHGFQTLQPDTEVLYAVSGQFDPSHAITVSFNDPELDIDLPLKISIISDKDVEGISLDQLHSMRIDWN